MHDCIVDVGVLVECCGRAVVGRLRAAMRSSRLEPCREGVVWQIHQYKRRRALLWLTPSSCTTVAPSAVLCVNRVANYEAPTPGCLCRLSWHWAGGAVADSRIHCLRCGHFFEPSEKLIARWVGKCFASSALSTTAKEGWENSYKLTSVGLYPWFSNVPWKP